MGGDPPSLDESRLSFATRRGRATSHESGTPESDQNVTWECPEPRTVALEPAGVVAGAEECLPGAVRRSGRSPPIAPGACWRSGGPRTDALVVGSGTGSGASGGSARQGAMDTATRTGAKRRCRPRRAARGSCGRGAGSARVVGPAPRTDRRSYGLCAGVFDSIARASIATFGAIVSMKSATHATPARRAAPAGALA
jgi:hypothetical protein